jgi:prostaglandin-H2 D-isomerase / glutathione transferase
MHARLTYFDFNGGRGEDCRLALHIAGVPFEDNRIPGKQWMELKPTTPFGQLPVLELGEDVIAQSNAILGLIGRGHELLPSGNIDAARHLAILETVEDLRARFNPTLHEKDADKKKAMREALAKDIPGWASNIEAQIEGPFFGGDEISVADLKLFVLMNWFIKGALDHVPTTIFEGSPKLMALHAAVADHEGVKSWYAAH